MAGALRFEHRSSRENPSLIESRCPLCNQFIAASKNLRLITSAESVHDCLRSLMERKKPAVSETS
jgi:hypothetical protein